MVMGVELWGRNPLHESGMHFRASYRAWGPLWLLMDELCSDLLDSEMLEGMRDNNGCGPHDGATCVEMAIRIDEWRRSFEGTTFKPESLNQRGYTFEVSSMKIGWWSEFLQSCGGFEVL